MKPIVTLTLNPTIDGSAFAEKIVPLHKIRTSDERYHAGGGGINVARVIGALGGLSHALYLAGGATGAILEDLLRQTAIPAQAIPISGYTRIAHTVFERASGQEYRFVPEGPEVSAPEWDACLIALDRLDFDYVVASGTLPRGLPANAYAQVGEMASGKGAKFILDTSGPALEATLETGVFLCKPSLGELEKLVGHALPNDKTRIMAARRLIAKGASKIIAITMGARGALLVTADQALRAAAPPVAAKSAVGAGDSFVGALTLALAQEKPLSEAFIRGVAAGTAAVLCPGGGLCLADDVARLAKTLAAMEVG
jgi:6-phosphofructokinase 2